MARPSIVPEILEKLEPWLEARMAEFQIQSEAHFGQWFSAGEPVVCLKNDYSLGLFNGLLGKFSPQSGESPGGAPGDSPAF